MRQGIAKKFAARAWKFLPNEWFVAVDSGEHRLPACGSRQLAANILGGVTQLETNRFDLSHRSGRPAGCRTEQAGSLCSPEALITRWGTWATTR
ncbi:MAG: hypothetical protein M3128_03910 [Verrucomicrobiota bacterium]|nr:hypothetical protein [Verrucomicrobiota bacterium]